MDSCVYTSDVAAAMTGAESTWHAVIQPPASRVIIWFVDERCARFCNILLFFVYTTLQHYMRCADTPKAPHSNYKALASMVGPLAQARRNARSDEI